MKKSWVVYILRCKDGTLYTGITNDLDARILKHNNGTGAKYTRSRRPVVCVWSVITKSSSMAKRREAALKKLTRTQKIKLIIDAATHQP